MKTAQVLPIACLVAGTLAGSIGCARTERAQPESTPKSPAPAAIAAPKLPFELPAAPLDPSVHGWELGKSYSYETKLSTKVDFEGAGSNFDFDILGTLELVPVKVTAESAIISARIPDARIVTRVPGSQGALDKLVVELRSSSSLFELVGGRIGALFVPPGMSQMAASSYRQLGSALQFAHPRDGSTRYTAEEHDTTGKYVAEYSPGSESNVWQKRKTRYVGILGSEALPEQVRQRVVPELVSSRGEIRLSDDGRPLRVRLSDELTLKGAQIPLASSEGIELDAKSDERRVAHLDLDALLAKSTRYGADEPIRDPNASRALDEAKTGGLDFDAIAKRLEQRARDKMKNANARSEMPASAAEVAQNEEDVKEQERLFHGLSAVLRNEPGATARAVARVRAGSPATDTLVDALGDVATPDAHRALARILGTTAIDDKVEARVILSLARTPKPTKEASDALKAVLERSPYSAGALYGLGTHSRLYRDAGKTKDATELGDFLAARFKRDNGPMTTVILLRAIANSGYIGALPRVLPFLDDKDEQIRATAVRALQSMHDPRIDGMIAARLKNDASADVRLSAIEAAKVREPSDPLVKALVEAGTHGDSPHVRYRAVEVMVDWLAKRPDLRATLDLVAKNDEEEKIRAKAKAAL